MRVFYPRRWWSCFGIESPVGRPNYQSCISFISLEFAVLFEPLQTSRQLVLRETLTTRNWISKLIYIYIYIYILVSFLSLSLSLSRKVSKLKLSIRRQMYAMWHILVQWHRLNDSGDLNFIYESLALSARGRFELCDIRWGDVEFSLNYACYHPSCIFFAKGLKKNVIASRLQS